MSTTNIKKLVYNNNKIIKILVKNSTKSWKTLIVHLDKSLLIIKKTKVKEIKSFFKDNYNKYKKNCILVVQESLIKMSLPQMFIILKSCFLEQH